MNRRIRTCGALALGLLPLPALAARAFTHSYEASTAEAGEREYAQWLTWETHPRADHGFDRLDLRHEFEFGLSERWQAAFYVPDWRYERGDSVADEGAQFLDVGVETIYQLRNPRTESYGLAAYGELRVGDDVAVLEPKLIVEKIIGHWILAWNGTIEAEWDLDQHQRSGALEQSLGLSYEFRPSLRFGLEAVQEAEYEDFSDRQHSVLRLGPNLQYAGHEWWLTLTPLTQLTHVKSEPDYQLRLIAGFEFE